jgi:uncharacterized repeat protein (TIGR01451 family)
MMPNALSPAAPRSERQATHSSAPDRRRRWALVASLCLLSLLGASGASAQVDVTATGGTLAASYTTLKGAFDAINAGTHTGTIGIGLSGNTTETAPAVINASGAGAAVYTTISISPTGGAARTITGAIAAGSPMIDFNGADNVTIDGLNTGGNSLTIANTTASATSGTATIRFIGGATGNVITNAAIQGSSSASVATNGGTIFFSTDAVTTGGNDNNTISNNNIGPAGANLPSKAILCNGSTGTTAIGNSGNVVNNNNIFDYFAPAVTSSGVASNGGCNTWSITNNRFYQTATRTWTTGSIHAAIDLRPTTATSGAQGLTVTGNIIGFASNTQTGTYTLTGAGTGAKFFGILINGIVAGTTSNVNNNTVASVSMTGVTSGGTTTASPFTAILLQEGNFISNGNTIGSQSATGSLTFSTTTTAATDVYGIHNFTSNAWTSNNNTVGGISVTNLGASGTFLLMGMRCFTGTAVTWNATSNTVGGNVANSLQLTATGAASQVIGMFTSNAPANLTTNTVRNLTSNIGTGTAGAASVIGIGITSTAAQNHLQNTIFGLTNTNATAATVVTGLHFSGSTANVVQRNQIYGLTSATNSTAAEINGIRVAAGTTQFRNNMIAIGAGVANAIGTGSTTGGINGIFEVAGTNSFFHNSVYIGGAPTAGVGPSYAFASNQVTVARADRNNVFFNARSNSGATGKNYVIRVAGTTPNPPGLTSNNNVLFGNGSGAVFGFFNSADVPDLPAWRVATGQDTASFSLDPQYLNPTAATPDLHIHPTNVTPIEANGADVGVVDDFDGQTRAGLTPTDIGADAGNFTGVDLSPPLITYTPFGNTSVTTNRTLTATITDLTGVATGGNAPRIYYRKNAGAYFSQGCSLATGTVQNGTWDCVINNADMGGVAVSDVIGYFVIAQDTLGNVSSNPPGAIASSVNTITTPPPPNTYTIMAGVAGPISVGTAETFTSLTNAGGIFEALNNRVFTGNVVVNITSDLLAETGLHALNRWGEDGVGGYTLVIRPTGAARAISGTANTSLIRIIGASRVTIDGSIDSLGTDRSLSITNTSVTTPSVVLFGSTGTTPVTDDTLKNTIITNGANTSSAVVISDATVLGNAGLFSNIVIQNNDIRRAFVGVFATGGTTPQGGSNLTYTQNTLNSTGATAIRDVGLYMQGVNGATVSQNTVANIDKVNDENDVGIWLATGTINANVTGNTVSGIGYTGTGAFGAIGINVTSAVANTNNVVSANSVTDISSNGNATGSLARGIVVAGATSDLTIERNNVSGVTNTSTGTFPAYGMDINGGNNVVVRNNFVSNVSFNMTGGAAFSTQFGVFGIRVAAGTGHRIYNNSVNLSGALPGTANASLLTAAFGLVLTTSTGVDVRDNIFANNITGGTTSIAHVAAYLPAGGTAAMNLTFNNNAYFHGTDAARQGVGQAGTTAGTNFFTTLAAQAAYTSTLSGAGTNDNASQASTGPVPFISATDLHLTPGSPLATAGVPLPGVTVDIDNEPRSATTPAIGADELTADLSITKTDGVTVVAPGGSLTYTIVASNAGPAPTAATVADTFPAVLTCSWTCVGAGGGTCTAGPVGGNINDTVSLPAGATVTYTASCNVSQAAAVSLSNTATVTGAAGDPVPGNNSATDTDTVTPSANIQITKTDGVASATPGLSVTYTIVASNAGPSNTTATVADTFPASLTCSWTCVGAGGGTCTAGPTAGNINDAVSLPAGGSVTYTASCNISAAASGNLVNTATVTGAAGDPVPGNNSATDTDTLTPSANLQITKTDGVTTATPGGSVTYTIVASNPAGPSNTTATVADTFPASLTCSWTCVGAGGGTCTAGPTAGNINDAVSLPAGGSVTYTASCNISPSATVSISNTATVTGTASDPVPGNNSATDVDTLTGLADIAVTVAASSANPGLGAVTFTVSATNNGPSAATGVVVHALLPAGMTLGTAVPSTGSYSPATGLWTIGNLGSAATATLSLPATVTRAESQVLVAGKAGAGETDPNASNNAASVRINGAALVDVQVHQTVDNAAPGAGSNVVFTVTARNHGPATATGVTLEAPNPPGLTYVSDLPSQGTYASGTGVWTVGSLASGAAASMTVTMTNAAVSPVTRTVTKVFANEQDLITGNDAASSTLNPSVPQVDLAITKVATQEPVNSGLNFHYSLVVTNQGPGAATGVTVTDNLPAGLTLVTATPSQGSCAGNPNISCNIGALAAGGSATVEIVVTKTVGGNVDNTASVAGTEADPNNANNSTQTTTTPVELISFEVD